ncbi:MAG: acyltransferase family protein, partial [Acidimicrobiales bacterium]
PRVGPPPAPRGPDAPRADFRPDIQGLRALAVVLVILSHAGVPGLAGGYVGVDVFFVISGFVITGLLLRQPPRSVRHNLAYFYQRRVRRIVPAATVTLVVTVVAARVLLGANFDVRLIDDVRWAALFAANFRFISTSANYFIPGVAPSLVTHFWSLGVEEQFYLCYPLVVFSLTWLGPARARRRVLAAFLVGAVALSAWWSIHLTHVAPITAYYSPFTRFWELALGGVVAVVPVAWARRTSAINPLVALGALAVLGVAVWRLDAASAYPGALAWWPCAATAVLIYTGAASRRGAPATWLAWRPCRYVGDISYSLYLWHYPWLMLPLQLAHPYGSPLARVVEVAGAAACAIGSYHLLENPIRRSRRLERDGVAVALVLLVCVALTIVTTLVVARYTSGA